MAEIIEGAANTEVETEVTTEETSPAPEEAVVEAEKATEEPKEEPKFDQTKAFSDRLNKMSNRKVDEFIASMGLVDEYNGGKAITTKAQYDAFQRMKVLDEEGSTDPAAAYRAESAEGELQSLRDQVRDNELQNDPVKGETYKEIRDEVLELVDYCRGNGTPCDIDSALNVVLSNRYWDLAGKASEKASKEAIEKINNNANASPGPLSGDSTDDSGDYSTMSSKEFQKAWDKVVSGGN